MILGYGIYERTHIKTGMQYAGKVWWTKTGMTIEKACIRRWRKEDKKGIRGVFGGFESRVLYSEIRQDVSSMSDSLYHFRIAVDEHHAFESIPVDKRLNKIDPLLQLDLASSSEKIAKIGGQIQGRRNVENRIGYCGRTPEKMAEDGRISGFIVGRRNSENGHCARIAAKGWHTRWHVNRNIINPDCSLCIKREL